MEEQTPARPNTHTHTPSPWHTHTPAQTVSPWAVQAAVAIVAAGRADGFVLALGDCAAPRAALKLAVATVRAAAARETKRRSTGVGGKAGGLGKGV
jgi:hypothetical protein